MKGAFITFEGIEGCGKSTQISLIAGLLERQGIKPVLTREPGGTQIGDSIRSILLDSAHNRMTSVTELLLYAASRHQHIEEVISPAISAGKVVLCDRYADATTAYQGAARMIDADTIRQIHMIATGGLMPGLTVLLDCEAHAGLARARARNAADLTAAGLDRFEREELKFHERVRAGYLEIARAEPNRVKVIDASGTIEEIHARVADVVQNFLHK